MLEPTHNNELPPIPGKRYFTIGEVSTLCAVKPHVLRYWEAEFPQLKPVKRRGNRRYYQRGDVELVRAIRGLLYEEGYTIGGARQRLTSEEAGMEQQIMFQTYSCGLYVLTDIETHHPKASFLGSEIRGWMIKMVTCKKSPFWM